MRQTIVWCWKWSWLLTLPASLLFVQWAFAATARYYTFGLRFNSTPINMTALDIGKMEFFHLKRKLKHYVTQTAAPANRGGELRKIHLFVSENDIARLDENLPYSGFEYVKGGLLQGRRVEKVKVKYRGDTALHWAYYKKSMRVKTRKRSLFEGLRAFNLIAPKFDGQLHNHLATRLASIMGLLAPRSEMVDLVLNGKPAGVFNLVEQLDEGTLRRNGRMPGDMYDGEWVGRDRYHGISSEVFLHPNLWEKSSVNNHYPEESKRPLERLILLLNAPQTERTQAALSRLLDMDAWGAFSAFELLIQSFHYDKIHNWRLYYDPWRTRFEPVIWDPVGWHPSWLPIPGTTTHMDIVITRLHEVLFQNGDFLRARQQAISDFFGAGLDQRFLSEADAVVAATIPAIERDPNLIEDPSNYVKAIKQLRVDIARTFAEAREAFLGAAGTVAFATNGSSPDSSTFSFKVEGRRPVREIQLSFAKEIRAPISGTLSYHANGQREDRDVSSGLALKGAKILVAVPLLPRYVPATVNDARLREFVRVKKERQMKIEPAYYELRIEGVSGEQEVLEILADRGGGLEPTRAANKLEMEEFQDVFSIVRPNPVRLPRIWSEVVDVEGVVEIEDEVVIRPGTTIRLHPGASLILHNRLVAQGTAQEPIRFLPATEGQEPWGTVALKGRGADRSRLVHCELVGGSGFKGDLFEYSGMLSVHDVHGVEIRDCLFRESKIVDDMVHAVYSEIRFINSVFQDALLDAVDLDISSAFLEGCRFTRSGNDALDLMTSDVVLVDSWLEGNQDKGVSIGEGSSLLAINNRFVANTIGVQAKDSSVVVLYNSDFIKNDHAIDAYKKNWRYGEGGDVFLYKGKILENAKLITADKHSAIWVHDTYVDREVDEDKSIQLDETVDSGSVDVARVSAAWLFPQNSSMSQKFETYRAYSDARIRGASAAASGDGSL